MHVNDPRLHISQPMGYFLVCDSWIVVKLCLSTLQIRNLSYTYTLEVRYITTLLRETNVVTIAVQECLRAMSILFNEREVAEIKQMYAQVEWVLDTLFFMYHAQNSAIGHFAQEKGITHLPLAEIEEQWISDPKGESQFFSEFRERNPRDYDKIKSHFDFNVFMLFQMLLQCDPAHLYLLSL